MSQVRSSMSTADIWLRKGRAIFAQMRIHPLTQF